MEFGAADTHFIILERTLDVTTPIAHDYFYESLVYDLLDIR